MRRCNKLLALLMSLIMVLSLVPVVGAEEAAPLATENDIVIYYTNDVPTYIDSDLGYDNIAALTDETAALAAGVLLVMQVTMFRAPLTVPRTRALPSWS